MVNILDGGGEEISSGELQGYAGAIETASGNQTPAEINLTEATRRKLDTIKGDWNATQQAVALEILTRAAELQRDLLDSVRQWAKPGRERALLEMLAPLVTHLTERDRLLLELRQRLNASPY